MKKKMGNLEQNIHAMKVNRDYFRNEKKAPFTKNNIKK